MAQKYPSLALRLASKVTTLLQSTARARPSTRDLKTISILPLDTTPRAAAFCRDLGELLDDGGGVLSLTADNFGRQGAPVAAVKGEDQVPHVLAHWLHDQEDRYRFLLFRCDGAEPAWTRFAMRWS